MLDIKKIVREEIEGLNHLYQANFPRFGDRLDSINELFERQPYPFTFDNVGFDEVNYHFDSPKNEYVVIMNNTNPAEGIWYMQFGTVGGTPDEVTNENKVSEVLSTLAKIVNDFADRYKPNTMVIEPAKDEARSNDDMRRYNIYMNFIKKNMRPDYYVQEYGDKILIQRKVKTKSQSNI